MTSTVELLDRLARTERSGMKLGLDCFRGVLADLGHPERRLRTVLVAGTNGKGSVATMLARVLQTSGYRTGLFTSPHLLGYRERVRVDGRAITRAELETCMARLAPVLARRGGSFFEAMTGVAVLQFVERGVELAVFEVGLGGRLDATNVGTPLASVVVGIGMDHTRILGHTIAAIAREKAAVARRGRPLVIGARGRARAVLLAEARRAGAQPWVLGRDARYRTLASGSRGSVFSYRSPRRHLPRLTLELAGRHQVRNAAVALLAAEALEASGHAVPQLAVGLARVRWPGRLEYLDAARGVLVDGAHNPEGARALARYLRENVNGRRPLVGVVGLLDRKPARAFLRPLVGVFDRWVLSAPPGSRALPPQVLARALGDAAGIEPAIEPDLERALGRARGLAGDRGLVCVCGSLRMVGGAMRASGRRRLERI